MGMSPVHDLLFESPRAATVGPRILLNKANHQQVANYAREVSDAFPSTVELIAVHPVRSQGEVPSEDLESFTLKRRRAASLCAGPERVF